MDLLLRRFLRAGVRRGVAGNWYWFLLAGATFFLRRVLNDRSSPVSRVTVSPGGAGAHHGARPQHRSRHRSLTPVAGPLAAGERVLLIDPKDRRYLLTLVTGATFHTHAGVLAHDDIIGSVEGCTVAGSTGRSFLALRPTLSDVVLKMPRGAQVIYPKDLGAILIAADIAPGQRVLEAGVGSGALSMTVLRAGASVVGYELREDFAERAQANVAAALGPTRPIASRSGT